ADVRGHVFTNGAVTPGDAACQASIFVGKCHGHAIELEFVDVGNVLAAAELVHTALPIAQLLFCVCVVEREHGPRVGDFDESCGGTAADALGGGIRSDEFGV